jgi:hypothetical protein
MYILDLGNISLFLLAFWQLLPEIGHQFVIDLLAM